MAHVMESEHQKRKRDVDDAGGQPGRSQLAHTPLQQGFIHYLPRASPSYLNLIQGDGDTFSDIIGLIGEYENVLDRHESLAINLGAKLTGPRLLRGIEKFFDGPIKTCHTQPFSKPIGWLDVVSYARSHPKDYGLAQKPDGSRWCQFTINGTQVEITEDDWRLVWSGVLDRFPLDQPLEEDELAELATLDILEQRASILYKKADEVAARARILNHKLGQRKQDIRRRCNVQDGSSSRFSPSSHGQRAVNLGQSFDLHADLLQQFVAASASTPPSRSASAAGLSLGSTGQRSPLHGAGTGSSGRNNSIATDAVGQIIANGRAEVLRSLITQRIDQLGKGDEINPPCDRCRRLKIQCVKHLTACVGCTKKHAKCSWKTVTDDEAEKVNQELQMKTFPSAHSECDVESDISEARDGMLGRFEDRHVSSRRSGERSPTATLAVLKDSGSRPPSREGAPLTTLEPPISVLMNRFDLGSERHRLSLGSNPHLGADIIDRSSEMLPMGHSASMVVMPAKLVTATMADVPAPPSTDGSMTASPMES